MKKNTIKRKTTGFDILYRVVTAIMAVATLPIAYFSNIYTIIFEHKEASKLLGSIIPEMKDDPGFTYSTRSLSEFPELFSSFGSYTEEGTNFKAILTKPELIPLWIAVAFFALALIVAIVILGFAIFSNTPKIVASLSGVGFAFMISSYISFTNFFAAPIIDGTLNIAKLFNLNGIFASVVNYLKIPVFKLESAFFIVGALILAILIWSVSVIIVNYGEAKEKEAKRLEKEMKSAN